MRERSTCKCAIGVFLAAALSHSVAYSQVATDGSLGPAVTLSGADIEVGQALGARVGDNLFHSFDRFSIAADQTVTFTGDDGVGNVISRVTGGQVSTIAGTLQSEVGSEGFFFINPSGVIIEENASIDVPAALHVSNATSIRFDDGTSWSTADTADATLTIASPEAFGFLSASSSGVRIGAAEISVADGATFDVSGVNVAIEGASIAAPNGGVRVQAVGENGEAPVALEISASDGALTVANSSFSGANASILFGGGAVGFDSSDVGATDFNGAPSELLISGDTFDFSAVSFEIRPDEVTNLAVMSLLAVDDIRIGEASDLFVNGERIGATTDAQLTLSAGGDIDILGGSVVENDNGSNDLQGLIFMDAVNLTLDEGSSLLSGSTSGTGGFFEIRVTNALLAGGSLIAAEATEDSGIGGAIGIFASESITLDNARISGSASNGAEGGLVFVGASQVSLINGGSIEADLFGDGAAGRIQVDVGDLTLDGGSFIATDVFEDFGAPGAIEIEATGGVLLTGDSFISGSSLADIADGGSVGVTAASLTLEGGSSIITDVDDGLSGAINITVGDLTLSDGSQISSSAEFDGLAGDITIDAASVALTNDSDIASNGGEAAGSGNVTLTAPSIFLSDGGAILSDTGDFDGGEIVVNADNLVLTDERVGDEGVNDTIIAADTSGAGIAGFVTISVGNLFVSNGFIAADTFAEGDAGDVLISATDEIFLTDFAEIATRSNGSGNAGIVAVEAGSLIIEQNAAILSDAVGFSNSGIIDIDADRVTIRTGASINSDVEDGFGGLIEIDGDQLTISASSISSEATGSGVAGAISIGVEQTFEMVTVSDDAKITTEAVQGAGGEITIIADDRVTLDRGTISTSVVSGGQDGGDVNVTVNDGFIVLHQNSNILTTAEEGDGGAMLISMDALYRSRLTRIDASSTLGFDGPIVISGLENPETAEAAVLPSDFLDANAIVRNPCLAAFLGRSQLQIIETGVSAGSIQGDSPLLDAATAGGLTLVGGDLSAASIGCDG